MVSHATSNETLLLHNARRHGLHALGSFGIPNDPLRISALFDGADRIAENFSEHDDALVGCHQMLEPMDRNRALPFLRFLIVGISLREFVAVVFARQRTVIGVALALVIVWRHARDARANLGGVTAGKE